MSEESKKQLEALTTEHTEIKTTVDALQAENADLKVRLEQITPTSGESTETVDRTQELETKIVVLEMTVKEKDERNVKLVKTVKVAKAHIVAIKAEREKVGGGGGG